MLDFIPSILSTICYGSTSPTSKKAIGIIGRHKAIVYAYFTMMLLLFTGAIVLGISINFPASLFPGYLLQITMGGLGVIASYKALYYGKSSIISPMSKIFVILVIATSIVFLGEELSIAQIAGSVLIVAAAVLLAMDNRGRFKPEKWMLYLGISIICRTYYYTFIKTFVTEMGPYPATMMLELGVVSFVVLFHAVRIKSKKRPLTTSHQRPEFPRSCRHTHFLRICALQYFSWIDRCCPDRRHKCRCSDCKCIGFIFSAQGKAG